MGIKGLSHAETQRRKGVGMSAKTLSNFHSSVSSVPLRFVSLILQSLKITSDYSYNFVGHRSQISQRSLVNFGSELIR